MTGRRLFLALSLLLVPWGNSFGQGREPGPDPDKHPDTHAGYDSGSSAQVGVAQVAMAAGSIHSNVNYVAGALDSRVWDLQSRVKGVREVWRTSDRYDEAARAAVRRSALRYAQALSSVLDKDLGLGALIVKNEYACFGFVIAAANDTSERTQLSFARKAEAHCRNASIHLHEATNPSSTDRNAKSVAEWASTSAEQPRINYLLAMSECLQATASKDERLKDEIVKMIKTQIPTYYLDLYPPSQDFVLSQCRAR